MHGNMCEPGLLAQRHQPIGQGDAAMRRRSLILQKVPLTCLRQSERELAKRQTATDHDVVELVGGPLDGTRLTEMNERFAHDPHQLYAIDGLVYRPWKVDVEELRVLRMKYVGPDSTLD
jgi:hypothetical protein